MTNIKGHNALKSSLAEKLHLLTDMKLMANTLHVGKLGQNIRTLQKAISAEKQVILRSYFSANSKGLKDRLVEPISIMENHHYLVAFDVNSRTSKVFKIDRCADIALLNSAWQHKAKHEDKAQDLFHITGSEVMEVHLKLKNRPKALLEEEYLQAIGLIEAIEEEHFHFQVKLPVRGWAGVGRFVLGLLNDIKVESPEAFKDYLREKVAEAHWLNTPSS